MTASTGPSDDACADGGCGEALAELERFLDGEAAAEHAATVRAHLDGCSPCTDRADFEVHIREIVRRRCLEEAAPPGLFDRIRACLDESESASAGG